MVYQGVRAAVGVPYSQLSSNASIFHSLESGTLPGACVQLFEAAPQLREQLYALYKELRTMSERREDVRIAETVVELFVHAAEHISGGADSSLSRVDALKNAVGLAAAFPSELREKQAALLRKTAEETLVATAALPLHSAKRLEGYRWAVSECAEATAVEQAAAELEPVSHASPALEYQKQEYHLRLGRDTGRL